MHPGAPIRGRGRSGCARAAWPLALLLVALSPMLLACCQGQFTLRVLDPVGALVGSSSPPLSPIPLPYALRGQPLSIDFSLGQGVFLMERTIFGPMQRPYPFSAAAPNSGDGEAIVYFVIQDQWGAVTDYYARLRLDKADVTSWDAQAELQIDSSRTMQLAALSHSGVDAAGDIVVRVASPYASRPVSLRFSLGDGATLLDSTGTAAPLANGQPLLSVTAPASAAANTTLSFRVRSQDQLQEAAARVVVQLVPSSDSSWQMAAEVGPDGSGSTLQVLHSFSSAGSQRTISVPYARIGQTATLRFTLPLGAQLLSSSGAVQSSGVLSLAVPPFGSPLSVPFQVQAEDLSLSSATLLLEALANDDTTWTVQAASISPPSGAVVPLQHDMSTSASHTLVVHVPYELRGELVDLSLSLAPGAVLVGPSGALLVPTVQLRAPEAGLGSLSSNLIVRAQNTAFAPLTVIVEVEPNSDNSWTLDMVLPEADGLPLLQLPALASSSQQHEVWAPYARAGHTALLSLTLASDSSLVLASGMQAPLGTAAPYVLVAQLPREGLATSTLAFQVQAQNGSSAEVTLRLRLEPNADTSLDVELEAMQGEWTHTAQADASAPALAFDLPAAAAGTELTLRARLPAGATWSGGHVAGAYGTMSFRLPDRGATSSYAINITAQDGTLQAYNLSLRVLPSSQTHFSVSALTLGGFRSAPLRSTDTSRIIAVPCTSNHSTVTLSFWLAAGATLLPAESADAAALHNGQPLVRSLLVGDFGSQTALAFTVQAEDGSQTSASVSVQVAQPPPPDSARTGVYSGPALVMVLLDARVANASQLAREADWQALVRDGIGFPAREGQQLAVTFAPASGHEQRVTLVFTPADDADEGAANSARQLVAQLQCMLLPTSAEESECMQTALAASGRSSSVLATPSGAALPVALSRASASAKVAALLASGEEAKALQAPASGSGESASPPGAARSSGLSDGERAAAIAVPVAVAAVLLAFALGMWVQHRRAASIAAGAVAAASAKPPSAFELPLPSQAQAHKQTQAAAGAMHSPAALAPLAQLAAEAEREALPSFQPPSPSPSTSASPLSPASPVSPSGLDWPSGGAAAGSVASAAAHTADREPTTAGADVCNDEPLTIHLQHD